MRAIVGAAYCARGYAMMRVPTRRPKHESRPDLVDCWLGVVVVAVALSVRLAAAVPDMVAVPGDSVVFTQRSAGFPPVLEVPAQHLESLWAAGGPACQLDAAQMMQAGGTLTVLAVRPDAVVADWQGSATAARFANCGGPGALILIAPEKFVQLQSVTHAIPVGFH